MRSMIFGLTALTLASLTVVPSAAPASRRVQDEGQPAAADRRSLRDRIERRFEVVPLRDGLGLRPRTGSGMRGPAVRMVEIADGTIAIDGTPVTGRELRDRLGADAEVILQLSYLDPQERRALFDVGGATQAEPEISVERPSAVEAPAQPDERESLYRRRSGERVRIFGNVHVDRDETIDGQVVAVLGSVRVDGEVTDQVVSVLGSIALGEQARVGGDVTSVGGSVRRAAGAEVRGSIHEIDFASPIIHVSLDDVPWWTVGVVYPFAPAARLIGTLFRALLLALLGSIILLVARQPIERTAYRVATEPVKASVVGVLAEVLFVPALVLTCVILAISIIGIPLLLLTPFVVVAGLFVLLGGFVATAYAVGGMAAGRLRWADQPYLRVCLGTALILLPVIIARMLALIGGPFHLAAWMVAALAVLIEYVAWTMGLGAALMGAYEAWQTRPARRPPPAPAEAAEPPTS